MTSPNRLPDFIFDKTPSVTTSDCDMMRVLMRILPDGYIAVAFARQTMVNDLSFIRWRVHFRESQINAP